MSPTGGREGSAAEGRFPWLPTERSDAEEALLELASNENPLGPSPEAVDAVAAAAAGVHRYPRAPQAALVARLAEGWDVPEERIWVGPGSVGVIDYLSRALLEPGSAVMAPAPGFSYFERSSATHRGGCTTYPLDRPAGFALDAGAVLDRHTDERIVYVNTPHNPTGAEVSLETIEALAEGTPDGTLTVVDEAYGPFTEAPSAVTLARSRDDVAVLRTFSKAYGLAGCRVGYAILPRALATEHDRVRTPWAVSGLSCVAARAALDDEAYLERSVAVARAGRRYLRHAVDAPTWPSEGNFVLVEVGDASATVDAALERGVRVRDCSTFGLPECVRVTVGTIEQTRRAAAVLNEVIEA